MPELPEVETVRRGLAPVMEGATVVAVEARRSDLRFPLPENFVRRLTGWRVSSLDRRAKYLLAHLTSGETLIMHLGMSGRFRIDPPDGGETGPGAFHHAAGAPGAHDHVIFRVDSGDGTSTITYNDARRFGFMDLMPADAVSASAHFGGMGPEPLGADFVAADLAARLKGRSAPVKQALLDQRIVAGLGNIYVCEALYRAGISPRRKAGTIAGNRAEKLVTAIKDVLEEAILAGGSTLRDHARPDGDLGYFQHSFRVYDREGDGCRICNGEIRRIVQSGRSTFFCPTCQR